MNNSHFAGTFPYRLIRVGVTDTHAHNTRLMIFKVSFRRIIFVLLFTYMTRNLQFRPKLKYVIVTLKGLCGQKF